MVEVLALPSRRDMGPLPDVLEQAARMLTIAATKASLIMRSPLNGCVVKYRHCRVQHLWDTSR